MDGETSVRISVSTNPYGVNQVYYERLQGMRLLDDAFMRAALKDNIPAIQLILRTVLGKDDLVVTKAEVQAEHKNLYGRSLVLDVEAVDSSGKRYDIEIQRDEYEAYPERGRYHMAIMDAHSLKPKQPFKALPTSYVVFIMEKDYYGEGQPVYHVDRIVRETGKEYGDRAQIVYANAAYQGENKIGRLMADFREVDPQKMHNQELAGRAYDLKYKEDEVRKMCKAMEITFEEGRMEGEQTSKVSDIENIMETLGLSLADAFNALRIPGDEHQKYTNLIAQRRLAAGNG